MARLQRHRLTALFAAARHSPLYSRIIGSREPSSLRLEDMPVVGKAHLMDNFKDWVCDPSLELAELHQFLAQPDLIGQPFRDQLFVWESSGSSGAPGIFVQDAAAMTTYDTLEAVRRRIPNPLLRLFDPWGLGERMAFVGATNGHFASIVSVERLRRLSPILERTLHSVSFLQPMSKLAAELEAIQPRVIATYPSVAILLAEARASEKLDIKPQEIWTGGETLTKAMRAMISQAFSCEVINSYGASEFMSLASECRHQKLHLNSDWAILEPVDDQHQPVPPGQVGSTTLLTNLANHIQPIIRYDLGDCIAIDPVPCSCGSKLPVISVQGRSGDLLRLGEMKSGESNVSALALSTVIESIAELSDFQLIQTAPNELELNTELDGEWANDALLRARHALQSYLKDQGVHHMQICCHAGQPSTRGRNGKVKRVITLCDGGAKPARRS
ncbi:phenylacetate--CoA ligase family protein [Aquabacterium sp.]|uniref:phenylacetate--CoA ligase family protein n=1 Tax=Aquabacterium sp. TaxID=1872578 RepID=UPI002489A5EE|nr:phenylacetate--CoA ligase family protein [Aquabacterium sp.]MDI1257672.1 phenylacetate--CoA ligase family protein [Aquabacterium sp.]